MEQESDQTNSNDRAFIKLAIELRQLENSILVGQTVLKLFSRFNEGERVIVSQHFASSTNAGISSTTLAKNCAATDNCGEPFRSYVTFINGLANGFGGLEEDISRMRDRVKQIQEMIDQYCAGQDIVLAKLARETSTAPAD